uniref:14-3-3-like protein A n=1 Tax=Cajanus cajan TaxID=3821 RepID=A0A151UBC6_CAJCA|nr:14-3-3-like protein A [Cajanus cajan]
MFSVLLYAAAKPHSPKSLLAFSTCLMREEAKLEREVIKIILSNNDDGYYLLRVISSTITPDSKVFYFVEFKIGAKRKKAEDSTLFASKSAQDITLADLAPTHLIRLRLALNFFVFYYEILNSPDCACNPSKQINTLLESLMSELHWLRYFPAAIVAAVLEIIVHMPAISTIAICKGLEN